MRLRRLQVSWVTFSLVLASYLTSAMVGSRTIYIPGDTSVGHHQIEERCELCHVPFAGVQDAACLDCHLDELEAGQDSHSAAVFADPRNADLLARLDARRCVVCHLEHRPDRTAAGGVTLPVDFCHACHADVGEERASHQDLGAETCQDCHRYHDNRTLHEEFLAQHLKDPALGPEPRVPARTGADPTGPPIDRDHQDAPTDLALELHVLDEWATSAHARSGVNCTDCHGSSPDWVDRPSPETCRECHLRQVESFGTGRHGMRMAAGLGAMTPDRARIPMQPEAERPLDCSACHAAHAYDTRRAAVEACLECHADEHSLAYRATLHHDLWLAEIEGTGVPGSGVSCATCHLPRREVKGSIAVHHDQNDGLRPNEKMVREVCLRCHGLPFSLDSLADPDQVRRNFDGPPTAPHGSLDMVRRRRAEEER